MDKNKSICGSEEDVEITSEMIDAGLSVFVGYSEAFDSRSSLCREIYQAMEISRRHSSLDADNLET